MHKTKYIASVVAAGILWGCISIFIKQIDSADFTLPEILALRALISSVILFIFLFFTDRQKLMFSLKDIWMFLGSGVISLTFFSMCYFRTILETGASVAVILLYTSPIFVLLLSLVLFREKITGIKLAALAMTFGGCILVSGILTGEGTMSVKGFFIGLGAGFGYALYSIFSRYALRKYSPLTVTFYTFLFSGLSISPFCSFGHIASAMNPSVVMWVIGIAFFCTVLPYFFYTYGLMRLETGKAAILVAVEPLVGTLMGLCVFAEPVTLLKITGIVLSFAAVILLATVKDNS